MLTVRRDNIFIGYGRSLRCHHCNNAVSERVYQDRSSIGVAWLNYINSYGDLFSVCPICSVGFKLKKTETHKVTPLLEAGKSETKKLFDTLSARNKIAFIKRLDKLKQKDLIIFLS